MPRRCIAAGCDTTSGMGYSLHSFPKDETLRRKWISAVKRQRSNWDGPSSSSLLCSKHFKEDCFATEGVRFREALGVPAQKRLKADAVPTVFAKTTDHVAANSSSYTPCSRPLSERREQRSVSMYMCVVHIIIINKVFAKSKAYIIAYKILKYLQIVSELLCATASTDTVSEGMDTTDSQSIVPSTSDAATQVVTAKMRSVHVSVRMKGRDKGKSVAYL